MGRTLTQCPVCAAGLNVTELSCTVCHTRVQGSFDRCRFCSVAPEQLAFVETFLRCEGNLSKVEKELNISYPTVRNRLAAALAALGLATGVAQPEPPAQPPAAPPPPRQSAEERRAILESLSSGSISAQEAAELLKKL